MSFLFCCSEGGTAVIKAQVLAGGRGKGHFTSGLQGGVKLADRLEVREEIVALSMHDIMDSQCVEIHVLITLKLS